MIEQRSKVRHFSGATIFSTKISYQFQPRWSVVLSNRYFTRHTRYTYYDNVRSSTYDVLLKLCYRL